MSVGDPENSWGWLCRKEKYCDLVYNFEVANEPNSYLVKGFAVHNCVAAIATSSMMTQMVRGKTLEEVENMTNKDVSKELDGLPPLKEHCSNLSVEALKKAIEDYKKK